MTGQETNRMQPNDRNMRFVAMQVRTNDSDPAQESIPVAFASCWINDPSRENAYAKAVRLLREAGWDVNDVIEDLQVFREDYDENNEYLQYFEQALIDDEVVVVFVPNEP